MSEKHIQPARLIAAGCKCSIHFVEILKIVSKISFSDLILICHKLPTAERILADSTVWNCKVCKVYKVYRTIECRIADS